jgi:small subunit ribosomal protein S6
MAGRARNLCAELAGQAHREEASLREYERAPRKYELMTILHPEVAEEALPGELERVSGYISAVGGELIETLQDSPWGRRRLAYPIRSGGKDVRDGYYTVWHFELAPTQLTEIERELKLNPQVIRYIMLSWEPKPLGPKEIEAAEIAAEDAAAAAYAAAQDAAAEEYEAAQAAAAAEKAAAEAAAAPVAEAAEAAPVAEAAVAEAEAEGESGVVIERASEVAEPAAVDTAETGEAMGLVTPAVAEAEVEAESEEKPVPAGAVRPDADGVCPADNPIKGNLTSMYYHAPGTRFYDRTIPEYCFDTVESAEAAGFGPTKAEAEAAAAAE